jgi:MFS superfamily sulfate permease-like transporter
MLQRLQSANILVTPRCLDSAGLPSFTAQHWVPITNPQRLVPLAMIIFMVDFLESLSISRAIARKYDYPIYPTREVTALAFSNFVGAMFGGYPSTGSFSRSAVAGNIGAKTTLQCFITGVLLLTLTMLTAHVHNVLPFCILSWLGGILSPT